MRFVYLQRLEKGGVSRLLGDECLKRSVQLGPVQLAGQIIDLRLQHVVSNLIDIRDVDKLGVRPLGLIQESLHLCDGRLIRSKVALTDVEVDRLGSHHCVQTHLLCFRYRRMDCRPHWRAGFRGQLLPTLLSEHLEQALICVRPQDHRAPQHLVPVGVQHHIEQNLAPLCIRAGHVDRLACCPGSIKSGHKVLVYRREDVTGVELLDGLLGRLGCNVYLLPSRVPRDPTLLRILLIERREVSPDRALPIKRQVHQLLSSVCGSGAQRPRPGPSRKSTIGVLDDHLAVVRIRQRLDPPQHRIDGV